MKDVDNILHQIRCFAEENKKEMSANVYEGLYNLMQGIEHDFKGGKDETKDTD